MPRTVWSGAISFGLISIPVKLFSAVSHQTVRFNQIDSKSGARVKMIRTSATTGEKVEYSDIVKGYDLGDDNYVVLTDEEMESIAPKASRSIDLVDFVEEADIDPIFYESGYFLAPDEMARKPYALLVEALETSGRVGIATFVMRSKQHLAAIRPVDGRLMLSTMLYADELVDPAEIPGLADLDDVEVKDAEKVMAAQLVESLAADFDPSNYEDTYRHKVMELIQAKSEGDITKVEAVDSGPTAEIVDLMAALEASVAAAKAKREAADGEDQAESA